MALPRVNSFPVQPSCIISSGHGIHLYWLLTEPTRDFQAVNDIHRGLAELLKGDYLTAATALRLPGSRNTKRSTSTNCEILKSDWSMRYSMNDFAAYRTSQKPRKQRKGDQPSQDDVRISRPDPQYIRDVTTALIRQGFKWRGTWLSGPCPNAYQHKHADRRPSFGFNTATGYGYCFVCGSMLLKDICANLGIASIRLTSADEHIGQFRGASESWFPLWHSGKWRGRAHRWG